MYAICIISGRRHKI